MRATLKRKTKPSPSRLLKTGDVAALIGVTKKTVANMIDRGSIKAFRIPGSTHRRVVYSDLVEFCRRNGVPMITK